MRKQLIIGTYGEPNRRMISPVTGKAIQHGAVATKLDSKHFVYINPGEVLTDDKRAELMKELSVPSTKKTIPTKTEDNKS